MSSDAVAKKLRHSYHVLPPETSHPRSQLPLPIIMVVLPLPFGSGNTGSRNTCSPEVTGRQTGLSKILQHHVKKRNSMSNIPVSEEVKFIH